MERVNQVWSTDITYIRMAQGFLYLVAVLDWFSRFVLSWALSLTMEVEFCVEALQRALRRGRPDIFNSDQGRSSPARNSPGSWRDGRSPSAWVGGAAAWTTFFVERLWRSLKYEEVYLKDYRSVTEARAGIADYFQFYNHERLHQSLDYRTPAGDLPGGVNHIACKPDWIGWGSLPAPARERARNGRERISRRSKTETFYEGKTKNAGG